MTACAERHAQPHVAVCFDTSYAAGLGAVEGLMGNIGVSELVVILLILMLVFGASRLPALGESLGKTIRSFKRGIAQQDGIEVSEVDPKRTGLTGLKDENAAKDAVSDAEIVEESKH
jgi:sec-independent protein translocase protein TatA